MLILQHPRERSHAFNTAGLTERSLSRCSLHAGFPSELEALLHDQLCGKTGLLYPHPKATCLSRLPASERPRQLVVLDGTWHHARVMYRELPQLHRLRHFTLPSGLTSRFLIRKQPAAHCLSTLEAVYHALRMLEPDARDLEGLLTCFDYMQARQLESMRGAGRHKTPNRARDQRGLPRALCEDLSRLVVAYGECDSWAARGNRRLLTWAACRPFYKTRFSAVVRRQTPSPEHLRHLQLSAETIRHGLTPEGFLEEWHRFCRPNDVLATWHTGTARLLRREGAVLPAHVALKSVYAGRGRHRGTLEQIARAEGLAPASSSSYLGRTGARLANALAMVELLRASSERSQSSS